MFSGQSGNVLWAEWKCFQCFQGLEKCAAIKICVVLRQGCPQTTQTLTTAADLRFQRIKSYTKIPQLQTVNTACIKAVFALSIKDMNSNAGNSIPTFYCDPMTRKEKVDEKQRDFVCALEKGE